VQVGGDVGALLLADPGGPLVGEVAGQPEQPRTEGEREAQHTEDPGDDHVACDRELTALRGEDDERGDEEPGAGRDPRPGRGAAGTQEDPPEPHTPGGVEPPLALCLVGLAPQHHDADHREERRPEQRRTAERRVDDPGDTEDQDAERHQRTGVAEAAPGGGPLALAAGRVEPRAAGLDGVVHRQDQPEPGVEDHAEPEDAGEQEHPPDHVRVDAEVRGEPGRDTAEVGAVGPSCGAADRRGTRGAHGPSIVTQRGTPPHE
jgi:hypothetical protein